MSVLCHAPYHGEWRMHERYGGEREAEKEDSSPEVPANLCDADVTYRPDTGLWNKNSTER